MFRSVQSRIAAAVIAITAIVGAVGAATVIVVASRALEEALAGRFDLIAQQTYNVIDTRLNRALANTRLIAENAVVRDPGLPASRKQVELARFKDILQVYEDVTLLDLDGRIVASTNYSFRGLPRHEEYFRDAVNGTFVMAGVHAIPRPFKVVVNCAGPVRDPDGNIVAVVVTQLNMETIWRTVGLIRFGSTGHALVVDERGLIVASPNETDLFAPCDRALLQGVSDGHTALRVTLGDGSRVIAGRSSLDSAATVDGQSRQPPWRVIVLQDEAEALKVVRTLALHVLAIALGLGAFAVVVARLSGRLITRPLAQLTAAAAAFAQGDFDHPVREDAPGELGVLAEGFLRLRDAIRHQIAALSASEETYRQLVENADSVIMRVNGHGLVTFINGYGARLLGRSSDDILETHASAILASEADGGDDDVESFLQGVLEAPGRVAPRQTRLVLDSGQPVWLAWNCTGIRASVGQEAEVLCIGTNITAMKLAEETVRNREAHYRLLFESSGDALFVHDMDGNLVDVNQRACDNLGYTKAELLELRVADVDVNLNTPAAGRRAWQDLAPGESITVESRQRTKDGIELPVEVHVGAIETDRGRLLLAVSRDVTERRRTEEVLRTIFLGTASSVGEEFFRSLVKHLADALGARYAIVGELAGNDCVQTLAVWVGDDWGENFTYSLDGTPGEQVTKRGTCLYTRGIQEEFPKDRLLADMGVQSYLGTPLCDASGTPTGLLAVLDDRPMERTRLNMDLLSVFAARAGAEQARNRAEDARTKLETQLRHAQKMEAVGQLAGGVAHDFNNILTAILGNVELALYDLGEHLPSDSPVLGELHEIEQGARQAASLTRQLLAFSRRQVVQQEKLDVNDILARMEKMLRRLLTEDIQLQSVPMEGLPAVLADAGQIEQVIMNLVVNARDAMPNGGTLMIQTDVVDLDEAYAGSHPDAHPGPHVCISVRDTGSGMDPSTLERVFEPFFTTKTVGRGTGLGLATVYGIVTQAGGHITVQSEQGKGTTFKVHLPVVRAERKASREPEDVPQEALGGTETVLLCEDDLIVRRLAERILQEAGYTVLSAARGGEALALADDRARVIDLLLTDVIMPDFNGKQLADALHEARSDLTVLFMSGYTSDIIAHHGVLDEGVEFIEKPFTRRGLLERVREVLDKRTPPAQ